jgi:hypothetical protein
MRVLRLILTFYKSFAFVSSMITLACLSITYTWGIETFVFLFWFKMITLGLILYYIFNYQKNVFYYYKNLGLTKNRLCTVTLSIDFTLFVALTIITLAIR